MKQLLLKFSKKRHPSASFQELFFNEEGHLNDSGISLYVEARMLNREHELPACILDHVENCPACQQEILEFYEFMQDDDPQELLPHPFLDRLKVKTVWSSLLRISSQIGKVAAVILFTVVSSLAFLIVHPVYERPTEVIKSPFENPALDLPYHEWTLQAQETQRLYLPNGTMVIIPSQAFVNAEGYPVEGSYTLKYRELRKASDIIASGIPNHYDTLNGRQYLESAAMFEIRAYQGQERLQMQSNTPIEVHLGVPSDYTALNQYYFEESSPSLPIMNPTLLPNALALEMPNSWNYIQTAKLIPAHSLALENARLLDWKIKKLDSLAQDLLSAQKQIEQEQSPQNSIKRAFPYSSTRYFNLSLNTGENPDLEPYADRIWEYAGEDPARSPTRINIDALNETWDDLELTPLKYRPLTLKGHKSSVFTARFSSNGLWIVTASADGSAKVWSKQGQYLFSLDKHRAAVQDACFSPDNQYILTASADHTAMIWTAQGHHLTTLKGHTGAIRYATFSPDGQYILTSSQDGTARLWNYRGQLIQSLPHLPHTCVPQFSPDSRKVLSLARADYAQVFDIEENASQYLAGRFGDLRFTPDGQKIITTPSTKENGKVILWSVQGKPLEYYDFKDDHLEISPQGNFMITRTGKNSRLWFLNPAQSYNAVLIRNIKDLPTRKNHGHQKKINQISYAQDGFSFISASADLTAKVWNDEGWLQHTLRGHQAPVNSAVIAPDGRSFLTASNDHTAKLWVERSRTDVYELSLTKHERSYKNRGQTHVKVAGRKFYTIVRPASKMPSSPIVHQPNPATNPLNQLVERYEEVLKEKEALEALRVPVKPIHMCHFSIRKLGFYQCARLYTPQNSHKRPAMFRLKSSHSETPIRIYQLLGRKHTVILEQEFIAGKNAELFLNPYFPSAYLLLFPGDKVYHFSQRDLILAPGRLNPELPFIVNVQQLNALHEKKHLDKLLP